MEYVLLFDLPPEEGGFEFRRLGASPLPERVVQRLWTAAAESLASTRVLIADCHGVATLDDEQPDLVLYTRAEVSAQQPNPVQAIEGIGELKADDVLLGGKACLGQVLHYSRLVLDKQLGREFVYAFLANSTHILFMRVLHDCVYFTSSMPLAQGTPWLTALLDKRPAVLGSPSLPRVTLGNDQVVTVEAPIGRGRSAIAYRAKHGNVSVVYKRFFVQDAFTTEATLLQSEELRPLSGRIPAVIASVPAEHILVISPYATQLRRHPGSPAPLINSAFPQRVLCLCLAV